MSGKIKFLVMDVDGTLTDGKLYISNNGEFMKGFNVKDGYGISHILVDSGICPIVITGRESQIVKERCKELGITKLYQGVQNKKAKLMEIISDLSKVAYIGDDLNDLDCMLMVKSAGGIIGCPVDAALPIKEKSDFVSNKCGGDGAVRSFIDWICLGNK